MSQLNEKALRPNVLKDLVLDIVSVDEFKPKLKDTNIVVQFQVKNNYDAAYDLSNFIEKSPTKPLDTEAVETPNRDSRYNVFVEFERNTEFLNKFLTLLKDIENLTGSMDWKMQIYQQNDLIDIDQEMITNPEDYANLVDLSSNEDHINNETDNEDDDKVELSKSEDESSDDDETVKIEEIKEFFDLSGITINESPYYYTFNNKLFYSKDVQWLSESHVKKLISENKLRSDNSKLSSQIINPSYIVMRCDEGYIVEHSGKFMLLK